MDDQSESNRRSTNSSSDEEDGRENGRGTRRDFSSNGNGGPSLQGIITFFTIGSGVLLLVILVLLFVQYFGLFSGGSVSSGSDGNSGATDRTFQNSVDEDIQISSDSESPFSSVKKRKQTKELLNRLVQEIRNQKSFRQRDESRLNELKKHVLTIMDFIKAVREEQDQVTLRKKKKQAKQAETRVKQLRDQLVNAYNSNKHPNVREKIDKLNFDIIWKVRKEMDAILNRNE